MQPNAQKRNELVGVHRFGDVIGGAGLKAFFAVALHGLGGEREDGQRPELRHLCEFPGAFRSRPFRAS